MKKIIALGLLTAAVALSACAKRAESVTPVAMTGAFDGMNCKQAMAHLEAERANVATLSTQQNSAATGDAVGVFLFAVPVSSLVGGNVEGQLATSKGKFLALEQHLMRC